MLGKNIKFGGGEGNVKGVDEGGKREDGEEDGVCWLLLLRSVHQPEKVRRPLHAHVGRGVVLVADVTSP